MNLTSSRTRFLLACGLAAVLLLGTRGTLAFWADAAPVAPGTIESGNVDLTLDGADDTSFSALDISGMLPGNSTAAVVTVRNAGQSPLTYGVDATATDPDGKGLRNALQVRVTGAAAVTGTGSNRTCAGSTLPGSGTSFGTGLVPASSRSLAPGAQESVCVQATLPNTPP